MTTTVTKGDRFVAYADQRPARRLYIEVTRVAKDGTWADIKVCTWAVGWTKRQTLDHRGLPPASDLYEWDALDLAKQEVDHMVMLAEQMANNEKEQA